MLARPYLPKSFNIFRLAPPNSPLKIELFLIEMCPANQIERRLSAPQHFTFMEPSKCQIPKFFELLSRDDQEEYKLMQSALSRVDYRNNRNFRVVKFQEILMRIREFCEKADGAASTRRFVCGVCHFDNCLALNIRQLNVLIDKCKSSINGSLKRMGLATVPLKGPVLAAFLAKIPQLESNTSELREWSVRVYVAWTPRPLLSPPPKLAAAAPNQTTVPTPPPCLGQLQEFANTRQTAEQVWSEPEDDFCLMPTFLQNDIFDAEF
jgi:hypothetical protein